MSKKVSSKNSVLRTFRIKKKNMILLKEIEEYLPTADNINSAINQVIESWHGVVVIERERFKKEILNRAKALGMHVSFGT